MVWAILALIGIPLWLCAVGIFVLVFRNRGLRNRPGNVPVRMLPDGKGRWTAGHAVWVHDVLAFRGSPAAWTERLFWVTDASLREPSDSEAKHLHRLGDEMVILAATSDEGPVLFAARADDTTELLGPFEAHARPRAGMADDG